ncbi:hypothetical protein [Burkholderia sp. Ac-20344]|uniref:hypothetical protein n=1 Tax=Burkholderia sp. Ac-20344 TaxID=2703890 RepID=UPI00197C1303|nr:hypothetical protein [Burkholderia sp. Ac-20344]MBN3832307.1 hypothetical protein [Burkholderia sp. Ac-20344]
MIVENIINSLGTVSTIIAIVTGVGGVIMLFKNYRSGSQIFSQGRTKRLYEIMKMKDQGWREISSGALQLAVKEAYGMQLSGDEIRFVLARDNALALLRSLEYAGKYVKFCSEEGCYKDNRFNWLRRFTVRQNFWAFLFLSLSIYFVTFLTLPDSRAIRPVAAVILMLLGSAATFILMFLARGAESASALMNVDEKFPLPKYGYRSESRQTEKRGITRLNRPNNDAERRAKSTNRASMKPRRRTNRSPLQNESELV